jgi:hypothetical protein
VRAWHRLAAAFVLLGGVARAAEFHVDSRLDNPDATTNGICADINGKCTLRAAVTEANAKSGNFESSTIFLPGGAPYVLSQQGLPDDVSHGDLNITGYGTIEIKGDGAAVTVIDANHIDRIFHAGTNLKIGGVTLKNGKPSTASHTQGGGAIFIYDGTLTLIGCVLESNDSSGSGNGGAISVLAGGLTMTDTTVRLNTAGVGFGGGISVVNTIGTIRTSTLSENTADYGGGIYQSGNSLNIENSTIYLNSAATHAGGIAVDGNTSTMKLNNVTLASNDADSDADGVGQGGGISVVTGASVVLKNSILVNLNGFTHDYDDCLGTVTSAAYNNFSTTSGCTILGGIYTVGDPLGFSNFAANGGPTKTAFPPNGSSAIGGGDPNGCRGIDGQLLTSDQRGVKRPIGARCDMGAVEVEPKGDANGDGVVNVTDVFYLINFLFAGGPIPLGRANVNGGSVIDVADVFYLINFLFAGGPAPV